MQGDVKEENTVHLTDSWSVVSVNVHVTRRSCRSSFLFFFASPDTSWIPISTAGMFALACCCLCTLVSKGPNEKRSHCTQKGLRVPPAALSGTAAAISSETTAFRGAGSLRRRQEATAASWRRRFQKRRRWDYELKTVDAAKDIRVNAAAVDSRIRTGSIFTIRQEKERHWRLFWPFLGSPRPSTKWRCTSNLTDCLVANWQ